jgi:hypothetical protein
VHSAIDLRWMLVVLVLLVASGFAFRWGASVEACSQARGDLVAAQRTLNTRDDRSADQVTAALADADNASNRVQYFCGKPQLPDR